MQDNTEMTLVIFARDCQILSEARQQCVLNQRIMHDSWE